MEYISSSSNSKPNSSSIAAKISAISKESNPRSLSLLSGVSEEQIRTAIDRYTSNSNTKNIDRVYDELSSDEIDTIFRSIEKNKEMLDGKRGLEDCLDDESLKISTEQEATRIVRESVLGKDKMKEKMER